jgi:hypothetical protein
VRVSPILATSSILLLPRFAAVTNGRKSMIRTSAAVAAVPLAATVAFAQTSPPTYQADPRIQGYIRGPELPCDCSDMEERHA